VSPSLVLLSIKTIRIFFLLEWISAGNMKYERVWHEATVLNNGKVLVSGTFSSDDSMKTCELYDPSKKVWTTASNMNHGRFGHSASILTDGQVLIASGCNMSNVLISSELYNPTTGR